MNHIRAFGHRAALLAIPIAVSFAATQRITADRGSRQAAVATGRQSTISGTIVGIRNDAGPIRGVAVSLVELRSSLLRMSTTDANGVFEFRGLPAGRYDLSGAKSAFLTTSFGAGLPGSPGVPIALGEGERMHLPTMSLVRGGVISGQVDDPLGRPLPHVPISAKPLAPGESLGRSSFRWPAVTTTDDHGRYRLFGLPPGDYVVRCLLSPGPAATELASRAGQAQGGRAGSTSGISHPEAFGYAPVYFPGTTRPADAARVSVSVGEETGGVEFAVHLVAAGTVRGTVVPPPGVSLRDLETTVLLSGQEDGSDETAFRDVGEDGRFVARGVIPGQYLVSARSVPRQVSAQAPKTAWWSSTAPVSLSGQDVSDILLVLEPAVTITGVVGFDSGGTQSAIVEGPVRAILRGQDLPSRILLTAPVQPDGTFQFVGVAPGHYTLGAVANRGEMTLWTLISARVEGREASEFGIPLAGRERAYQALVTLRRGVSEVCGLVKDALGGPAYGAYVIVFPTDAGLRTRESRRIVEVRSATDGTYCVRGVPPGEYAIAATTESTAIGGSYVGSRLDALGVTAATVSLDIGQVKRQDVRVVDRVWSGRPLRER